MNRRYLFPALLFALSAASGCATPADEADVSSSDEELATAVPPRPFNGIEVVANYSLTFPDYPPTLGSQQTIPVVDIEIVVDDAAVANVVADFDGYERAFALVPRMRDGQTRFERVELPFEGRRVRGFIALRWVDIHGVSSLRLDSADRAGLLEKGIAVGLETNRGTVWAQLPDRTHPVTRKSLP